MKIERERWVIIKGNEIYCGLAQPFQFKPIDNIGDIAIRTYLSKNKAKSSFLCGWCSGRKLLESGEAKIVKVIESLVLIEEENEGKIV